MVKFGFLISNWTLLFYKKREIKELHFNSCCEQKKLLINFKRWLKLTNNWINFLPL